MLFAAELLKMRVAVRQAEVLMAVAGRPRVAVKSGHKIGKSTSAAILALWFTYTRPGARVIMTSSTDRQVRMILWREVRRLHARVRKLLPGDLHVSPDPGLQLADGGEVVGFSTKEPEKMAGISGAHVLFLVDEASGVPEEIFDAIEGNRAGGAKICMFSNPTQTSGYFYEAFNARREAWSGTRGTLITVSSEEVVNEGIPGLATKAWIDEIREERGIDSVFFAVRVRGEFPAQGDNAVIPLYLVERATRDWRASGAALATAPLVLGVDVGRFGDDETVIAPVRGTYAYPVVAIDHQDGAGVAGKVLEVARALRVQGERVTVNIDAIGVGASPVDFLRQHSNGERPELQLNAVNVGERARAEGYVLLRDEVWFAVTDWLKAGGVFPPDPKLEAELVAPSYAFDVRSRVRVDSKDHIKKRIKRSPDRADALGLAVFKPSVATPPDNELARMLPPPRMAHARQDNWDDDD